MLCICHFKVTFLNVTQHFLWLHETWWTNTRVVCIKKARTQISEALYKNTDTVTDTFFYFYCMHKRCLPRDKGCMEVREERGLKEKNGVQQKALHKCMWKQEHTALDFKKSN